MDENKRERRRERAIDLLDAWAGIGGIGRLIVTVAIIGGVLWMAVQIAGLILMLKLALTGS